MKQRILLVSILRADRSISGEAFRYMALWRYLRGQPQQVEAFLLTNETLKLRTLGPAKDSHIFSFDDRSRFYVVKRIFACVWLLWLVWRLRITSVHLAAGGADYMRIFGWLFRLFSIKVCTTFACVSIDVMTEGNPKARRAYETLFRNARNMDILSPTHVLPEGNYKKFVAPCSFPWTLQADHFPSDSEQKEREPLLVFSGTFAAWKNPTLAIEGFNHFLNKYNDEFPKSRLVMIGRGVLEPSLREIADAVNQRFGREAVFFGEPGSSLEYLSRSAVFLSLQVPDNYPSQALMEAMLLCNHVLATDTGDTKLMVRAELGNQLVSVDAPSVGEAIAALLRQAPVNQANRDLILREHCVERFADYFLDMHRNLVL